MKQSVERAWQAWREAAERKQPSVSQALRAPASKQMLSAAERALGVTLPEDFRSLYRLHDGGSDFNDLFCGHSFMSLNEVIAEVETISRALEDLDEDSFARIEEELRVTPPDTIKQQYFNHAWIPFASDGGGNYIGVDLDPGETGVVGQVINFGPDDLEMFVIAVDIVGFLEVLRHLVEEGPYQRPALIRDLWNYLYA